MRTNEEVIWRKYVSGDLFQPAKSRKKVTWERDARLGLVVFFFPLCKTEQFHR